jgi:hypothetical protein
MLTGSEDIRRVLQNEIQQGERVIDQMRRAYSALSGELPPGQLADAPQKRGPGRPKGSRNKARRPSKRAD